jgi:hypothetical protein
MIVDLPLEVAVVTGDDGLTVHASAPTQTFRTGVMPVFHRSHIVIELDRGQEPA